MALARNHEETFALERFRRNVQDLEEVDQVDKGTLMRFLRARNLHMEHAEEMLRAYVGWRKNNIYEAALRGWKPPQEFVLKFEVFHCGKDAEGRPVFYINFNKWLPSRHLFEEFKPHDFVLFAYSTFMRLYKAEIACCETQQIVAIIDNEGIGFSQIFQEIQNWVGVQTLIDIWTIYEANFPETLHKAFFINTASAFMWGFRLVKPFVTKHTLSKISIYGSEETKYKPAIQNFLPDISIPEKFGGSSKMKSVYDLVYSNNNIVEQKEEIIEG